MHFSCEGERNCQIKSEQEETVEQTGKGKDLLIYFLLLSLLLWKLISVSVEAIFRPFWFKSQLGYQKNSNYTNAFFIPAFLSLHDESKFATTSK